MSVHAYVGLATLPGAAGLTIAEENALAGAALPSISGAGNSSIQGFCREFSVDAGETANFSVTGAATTIDIYRLGYYAGAGARLVTTIANTNTSQPASQTIANSNGAVTCANWSTTAQWDVPADATSGFYVGVPRTSGGVASSWIPFVVRRDDRPADIMVKTSEATWGQAYNSYNTPASPLNGKSYYGTYDTNGTVSWAIGARTHAATLLRPITSRTSHPVTYWMNAEAPLIRYLERNGFDLSYSSCKDWRAGGPTMAACKVYISSGHDEYWSQGMRDRWEALRDAGKHLLFMSGNEVFWKTRYDDEHAQGGNGDVLWCYKDTMDGPGAHTAGSPLDPVAWSGTWRDTRWASREPERLLTGTTFRMNGIRNEALTMSAGAGPTSHQFWRHTNVNANGISISNIIGFEADDLEPQQPVASRATLASRSININGFYADDNGENYSGNGTLNWGVGSQRYASGAVVVGFGTCQWAWGLDNGHDNGGAHANAQMQQATLNLLYDLGATADTPMGTLTVPTPVSLDNYGAVP